uniref:Uncharacterized protein n=1 Tax=Schistosoma curassoni TaxID=6186 RepID=A0A183L5E8_9TREM
MNSVLRLHSYTIYKYTCYCHRKRKSVNDTNHLQHFIFQKYNKLSYLKGTHPIFLIFHINVLDDLMLSNNAVLMIMQENNLQWQIHIDVDSLWLLHDFDRKLHVPK